MSDVATLNSLIKHVADLGSSIKNVEVDEDERGLILRVPRADGPFDITMPQHLHLDPEDFDDEQGCISEKADMLEPVRAFWNAYIAALFDEDDRAALADIRPAVGSLLAVGRSPNHSQPFKGAFAPRVIKEGNVLRLTHLTMSFLGRPALAQTIFRSLSKENDIPNPDELWPPIKAYNMRLLFQAYQVSHGVKNACFREKLSDALSLQIEALIESH